MIRALATADDVTDARAWLDGCGFDELTTKSACDDPNEAVKAIIWLARRDLDAGLTMQAAIAEYDRRIALRDQDSAKAGGEGA